ncbi:MAG: hypothetical protein ACLT9P_04255 [Evtepia gabavorous]
MHLKKLLALGLSLTMAVALLSGCGQQETAEGGTRRSRLSFTPTPTKRRLPP